MSILVAVDIGGTFTDFVALDTETGRVIDFKVPSTPPNFASGFSNGLKQLIDQGLASPGSITAVFHGTTVGTNALIERRIPKLGLITTQGMRDVLEIRRHWRGPGDVYNFFLKVPEPLVPRDRRIEVRERILADGSIETPLNVEDVRVAISEFRDIGVESLAVCLLHAYANPSHELRVRELIEAIWPEVSLSVSHQVCGELREYERTSTTVVNSALLPVMRNYLRRIGDEMRGVGVQGSLQIMQSNGGLMTPEVVADRPVSTILSGPVGGVMGGIFVGRQIGETDLITLDMGGTSCDVCLVENGVARITTEKEVEGNPVRVPMFDMVAIGAGGGSIAWIDVGGSLQVGPPSAGASPGPACYGLGGSEPTITDANVVLGRIDPACSLGGTVKIQLQLAETAIQKVAKPFGMSVREAALGILKIANAKMVESIKVVSVRKGHDPRDFSLVVGGGAGPLHGVFLADELQMRRTILPMSPGTLSAFGLLTTDVKFDIVKSNVSSMNLVDCDQVNAILSELSSSGEDRVKTSQLPLSDILIVASADLRYVGQAYEIIVPIRRRPVDGEELAGSTKRFHAEHERLFGYAMPEEEVELVNLRIQVVGRLPDPMIRRLPAGDTAPADEALIAHRETVWQDGEPTRTAVYRRSSLQAGNLIIGPAILEQSDSTVAIPAHHEAKVDEFGNLVVGRA